MTQSNALEVDERQPLLAAHQDAQSKTPDAGLPWGQVAVLAIWRATHVNDLEPRPAGRPVC